MSEPSSTSTAIRNQNNQSNESGIGRSSELVRELLGTVLRQDGPAAFCDMLLERADLLKATDIHFDPAKDGTHLRFRVDGFMHEVTVLDNSLAAQVMSRIKLLAGMDITDRRLAQDGHLAGLARNGKADIRIGTGPTIHGERLVMRLMPDPDMLMGLESLGMLPEQQELVRESMQIAGGMMLVVGPVGSGKSTTTYSCLSVLNRPEISTVTIEDPVERQIEGANQVQVDPRIEFGFVQALRGVLRQDPDVIMVGEIRDPETANIAIRAALTGVNVLSTLHASDTSTVIDVLRQFGIPPIFMAESLKCVIAQRLVRLICPKHRERYVPDALAAKILRLSPEQAKNTKLLRGLPAPANFHTGYDGRTGIFEVMAISDEVREAVMRDEPAPVVHGIAKNNGLIALQDAAVRAVLAGTTTVNEIIRVLPNL